MWLRETWWTRDTESTRDTYSLAYNRDEWKESMITGAIGPTQSVIFIEKANTNQIRIGYTRLDDCGYSIVGIKNGRYNKYFRSACSEIVKKRSEHISLLQPYSFDINLLLSENVLLYSYFSL